MSDQGQQKYVSPLGWFYEHICKPVSTKLETGSLLYAVLFILFFWFMAWVMDQKKWYVKV